MAINEIILLALLILGEAADQPVQTQLGVAYVALNRLALSDCSLWDIVVESGEFCSINVAVSHPETYIGRYWHKPENLSESETGRRALLVAIKALSSWPNNDPTHQATHFENIERFGEPYWASKLKKTVKLGDLTFFAERRTFCRKHNEVKGAGQLGLKNTDTKQSLLSLFIFDQLQGKA